MKAINTYINEKLVLNKDNIKDYVQQYNYHPKDGDELKFLVNKLIDERGNNADLNDIDTSNITSMSLIFANSDFDGDISKWDVSNVEDMYGMFRDSKFNGDISKWDVSKVKDMSYMFWRSNFSGDISSWDISNAKYINGMFKDSPLQYNPPKWYK